MITKICNKCREKKTLDCFHKDRNRKDGLKGECKSCRTIESRERREKYKQRLKIQDKLFP